MTSTVLHPDAAGQIDLTREDPQGLGNCWTALSSNRPWVHAPRDSEANQVEIVTQALFAMGLETRSIELLLDRDPSQVAGRLATLRGLQRDALAAIRGLTPTFATRGSRSAGLLESGTTASTRGSRSRGPRSSVFG
jgi:hypothetical protein